MYQLLTRLMRGTNAIDIITPPPIQMVQLHLLKRRFFYSHPVEYRVVAIKMTVRIKLQVMFF